MRIAINTRFLLSGKLEGLGRYTHELVQRIVKNHPEHEFFFFFDRAYSDEFIYAPNVTPVVLNPPARHPFLWYLWFEFAVPRALKKHKIDYFISPDTYLSLKTDVKQLLVVHDLAFEHFPEGIPKLVAWFYKGFSPKYCQKANRIISVSTFTKKDIIEQYGISDSKIDAILNGVSTSFAPISEQSELEVRQKHTNGKPYFVSLGAMHPRKNIAGLLKAFENFKNVTNSDFKLVLVGRKAWGNETLEQTFEQMKHKNDIVFTGRVSDEELNYVLGASHALCYVPFFEGFGLPIVEAQACGIPVITSATSSMPEVLGDGGLLVNPYEIETISKAMQQILDEKLRNELAQKAIENVKRFSWDNTAIEFWNSFEKILV